MRLICHGMMNALVLLFLLFFTMERSSLVRAISPNIFMSPDDYLKLQSSDMETELQKLDEVSSGAAEDDKTKASEVLWEKQTNAMAAVIQAEYEYGEKHVYQGTEGASPSLTFPHPALSLLVCDYTPLSVMDSIGMSRMERLSFILENSVKEMTKNEEIVKESIRYIKVMQPLSNTDESTCFMLSVTASLGMALFHEAGSKIIDMQLRVQPVLPMMKIREGTLSLVKEAINESLNGSSSPLQFFVTFSPGVHAHFNSFNEFVGQGLHGEELLSQTLNDAFPYTSLQLKLEDLNLQESLDWILNGTKFSIQGETDVSFELFGDSTDGQVTDIDAERERCSAGVLMLLSALAARGEVLSIEALPRVSTFQNGGDRRNLRLAGL